MNDFLKFGNKSTDLEKMLKEGYTRRFANFYLNLAAKDYEKKAYSDDVIKWAHSHGFLADKIAAYKLNDDNVQDFLSDYDYYKLWPLNNPYRIWINDKLTLKYILPDNLFGKYLPKYYFYTEDRGVIRLLDCDKARYSGDVDGVKTLLRDVKVLAMKLVNGTASNNFYKLSYQDGALNVNSSPVTEAQFDDFIKNHKYYVITEYLIPHKELYEIFDKIHTLRLMVINPHGEDPYIAHGYLRFGTSRHGEANHSNQADECKANYDFVTQVDVETGAYGNSVLAYYDKIIPTPLHPDTKVKAAGVLPFWDLIKTQILSMSNYLFEAEYCGFDVGITDDGFKIMEINSHQGIGFLQIFRSLYATPSTERYFKDRLAEIDGLSAEDKQKRNGILR